MKNLILRISVLILIVSTVHCWPTHSPISRLKKNNSEKSKGDAKTKNSTENSSLTEEEKNFLKEIEEKYNLKGNEDEMETEMKFEPKKLQKLNLAPLPAVIAIEIVNDTSVDGKGKRTIDANLGYGYKTNNGYVYNRFGKPGEEKGKFMIYPYSQHDIPPLLRKNVKYNSQKGEKTIVEIQPSKAYQLIPIDSQEGEEEHNSYGVDQGVTQLQTKFENIKAVETPPPPQYHSAELDYSQPQGHVPTTLFSTYNGGQLSSLSGHFPAVMPNYFVSPSQILNHPHYQSLGLQNEDQDHLTPKRIIPILILRIPSSHIQNPSAELYPKLPPNHPYAMSLNNINIQSLVSDYLANIQAQYVAPTPITEPKFYHQFPKPVMYYQPQVPLYTTPNYSPLRYTETHNSGPQYLPSIRPTFVHHPTGIQKPSQNIQYIVPRHPLANVQPHPQIYSPSVAQHSQDYETSEEQQSLPFSENYPDAAHTQVLIPPQYHNPHPIQPQVQNKIIRFYQAPAPVPTAHPYTLFHPPQQNDLIHNSVSQNEHSEDYVNEEQSPNEKAVQYTNNSQEKEVPPMPFNYHAHPFPKRQTKSVDRSPSKKDNQHSSKRRLISDVRTAV